MTNFKYGDRVEISNNSWDGIFPVGHIGYVYEMETHGCRVSEASGDEAIGNWYPYEDLKLIEPEQTKKAPTELTAGANGKVVSDGGPSAYYDFPEGATTLNDLIEFKGMSFAQGNIFKAAFRLGNKEGISLEYDLKKIIYYADRMLKQLENQP